MNKFLWRLASIIFSLAIASALAAPPQSVNYQGYLATPAGVPVNSAVSMTFRLYNSASGGGALWTETQGSVNVVNGSFNVALGTTTPITLPFDVPYWFSVTVNADAEMSPRQPLASSPYAFRAGSLDSAATIAGTQVTGTLTSATVTANNLTGLINPANLPSTQLLPTSACGFNQIAKWNGSSWQCASDDNYPPGFSNGQVLAAGFGPPVWTSTPTLSGLLTLQNGLELSGLGNVTKNSQRFMGNPGSANTFLGLNAGFFGGGGSNNTAVGDSALSALGSNANNTAVGAGALRNSGGGAANVGIGANAGQNVSSGSNNTLIGTGVGSNITTGGGNIIIGSNATSNSGSGFNDNIYIGAATSALDLRVIRIGTVGAPGHLQTFIAGISGFPVGGSSAVTIDANGHLGNNPSSRRFKDDITDMNDASSALMQLRPVTFHYKADQNPAGRELQYGLIAEEVNEVYPGLVAHDTSGEILTVMYQHLPPMLLNEFQKQQRTIQAQAARLDTLERELQQIKSLLGKK